MKRAPLALLGSALVLSTIAAAPVVPAGGWATVTVDKVPDSLVVGKAVTLTFTIKQHGVRPMAGLKPKIHATTVAYSDTVRGTTRELKKTGDYSGSIQVASKGEWLITIESGFGPSKTTLKPIKAVDDASRIAASH